jgi:hypothetical protein
VPPRRVHHKPPNMKLDTAVQPIVAQKFTDSPTKDSPGVPGSRSGGEGLGAGLSKGMTTTGNVGLGKSLEKLQQQASSSSPEQHDGGEGGRKNQREETA